MNEQQEQEHESTRGPQDASDSGILSCSESQTADTNVAAVDVGAAAPLESLPRGPISRQVLVLALPMLGEQFGNFLIGLVDIYLAGELGKEATAAVGTGGYMGWFLTLAFTLVGVGATALVARSFGGRDIATADRALNQAIIGAAVLGLAVSFGAFFAAPVFAAQLTQTPAAFEACRTYLRIDAFGYGLASLMLVGGAVLRGAGDTRTPMLIMIVVNIINAAVSLALVRGWFGPPMGVFGIAVGTVVARCAGGLIMAGVLAAGRRGMRLRFSMMRPDFPLQWRMLRIGLPTAGEAGIMWIAQMSFLKIIANSAAQDAGTANYAAHMIAMRAEAIGFLPAFAWMTASATLVGQYLGAGQPRNAARAGHTAAVQGCLLVSMVGVCFYVLADAIYAVLTDDPLVHKVGVPAFRLIAFAQPFLGMGIIYIGSLRGAGDTLWPFVFTTIATLCIRVPGAYIGAIVLDGGLIGAWCGMWADNFVRFLLAFLRFLHGGWQRVKV